MTSPPPMARVFISHAEIMCHIDRCFRPSDIGDFMFENDNDNNNRAKSSISILMSDINAESPHCKYPICIAGPRRCGKKSIINMIYSRTRQCLRELVSKKLEHYHSNGSLMNEKILQMEPLVINASESFNGLGTMNVIRESVSNFVSNISINHDISPTKVVIIYDIDKISKAAQKSILPMLEMENILFMVTCEDVSALPNALVSRLQIINITRVCGNQVYRRLISRINHTLTNVSSNKMSQAIIEAVVNKSNCSELSHVIKTFLNIMKNNCSLLSFGEMVHWFKILCKKGLEVFLKTFSDDGIGLDLVKKEDNETNNISPSPRHNTTVSLEQQKDIIKLLFSKLLNTALNNKKTPKSNDRNSNISNMTLSVCNTLDKVVIIVSNIQNEISEESMCTNFDTIVYLYQFLSTLSKNADLFEVNNYLYDSKSTLLEENHSPNYQQREECRKNLYSQFCTSIDKISMS